MEGIWLDIMEIKIVNDSYQVMYPKEESNKYCFYKFSDNW